MNSFIVCKELLCSMQQVNRCVLYQQWCGIIREITVFVHKTVIFVLESVVMVVHKLQSNNTAWSVITLLKEALLRRYIQKHQKVEQEINSIHTARQAISCINLKTLRILFNTTLLGKQGFEDYLPCYYSTTTYLMEDTLLVACYIIIIQHLRNYSFRSAQELIP